MKQKECKGCDFLAVPEYFTGVRNGVPQYDYSMDEEYCSCCYGIDGGRNLESVTICPKERKIKKTNAITGL